jgi:radical SAM protein with 4Fe4S-binding SPASM domain
MLHALKKTLNKTRRIIKYCTPMPSFSCDLPIPKPLIAGYTHRLPCDIHIPYANGLVERDQLQIRMRWIGQDGVEYFAGQAPILRGSHARENTRVIAQIHTPQKAGTYALAVALVRGRRERELARSDYEWPVMPLAESDGFCHYGEYMLGLDASTRCNLECIFCLRVFVELPPAKQVTREQMARLAEQAFDGCSGISMSLGAEPLMNTQFEEIVDLFGEYPYVFTTMTSNGIPLNERKARLLVEKGYKEISISIDGVKKETYESIRKGAKFEQLIENLKRLQEIKREMGSPYPRLKFHFAMMKRNVEEMPAYVDMAHELGAEIIRFQHFIIPHEDLTGECLWFEQEKANRYLSEALRKCEEYGIKTDAPPLFDLTRKSGEQKKLRTEQCHWPWKGMLIGHEGEVYPCCQWKGSVMGNVNEQTFEAIWNGEKYRQLRNEWICGELNENCRNCSALMEGDVNDISSFFAAEYERINGKPPTIPLNLSKDQK